MLAPLVNVRCNLKMDRYLIKKGQKTKDKPDGQTHRVVKIREEKEFSMKTPKRGQAAKRQVFRVKKKKKGTKHTR